MSAAAIDESFTVATRARTGERIEIPNLSPHWCSSHILHADAPALAFPPYLPPCVSGGGGHRGRAWSPRPEGFDLIVRQSCDVLRSLLSSDFRCFWSLALCDAAFSRKLLEFLLAFCANFPRPWEICPEAAVSDAERELFSLGFDVIVRLMSREESLSCLMSRGGYDERVVGGGLVTARTVVSACALYATVEQTSLARLARAVDAVVSECGEKLERGFQQCFAQINRELGSGDLKLGAAATLASMLRVCPALASYAVSSGTLQVLCACHDSATPSSDEGERLKSLAVSIVCTVVNRVWVDALASPSLDGAKKQHAAEALIAFLDQRLDVESLQVLPAGRMTLLGHIAAKSNLAQRISSAAAANSTIVERERLEYFATVLRSKVAGGGEVVPSATTTTTTTTTTTAGAEREAPPSATPSGSSAIEEVMDLFPDAEFSKVQDALRRAGGNVEQVIADALEGKIQLSKPKAAGRFLKPEDVAPDVTPADRDEMRAKTIASLDVMEEEEERERIRDIERRRLAGEKIDAREYDDEYDDSYDAFVRLDLKDGGDIPADAGGAPEEEPQQDEKEKAESPEQEQQPGQAPHKPQAPAQHAGQQGHRRGGGGHHQKDRSMRKRSLLFPR